MTADNGIVAERCNVQDGLNTTHQAIMEEDALEVFNLRVDNSTHEFVHIHSFMTSYVFNPLIVEDSTVSTICFRFWFTQVFFVVNIFIKSSTMSVKEHGVIVSRCLFSCYIDDFGQNILIV